MNDTTFEIIRAIETLVEQVAHLAHDTREGFGLATAESRVFGDGAEVARFHIKPLIKGYEDIVVTTTVTCGRLDIAIDYIMTDCDHVLSFHYGTIDKAVRSLEDCFDADLDELVFDEEIEEAEEAEEGVEYDDETGPLVLTPAEVWRGLERRPEEVERVTLHRMMHGNDPYGVRVFGSAHHAIAYAEAALERGGWVRDDMRPGMWKASDVFVGHNRFGYPQVIPAFWIEVGVTDHAGGGFHSEPRIDGFHPTIGFAPRKLAKVRANYSSFATIKVD